MHLDMATATETVMGSIFGAYGFDILPALINPTEKQVNEFAQKLCKLVTPGTLIVWLFSGQGKDGTVIVV